MPAATTTQFGTQPAWPERRPGMRWFVLRTRSRQEKALGTDLARLGVGYFLPLANAVRYYGKRKAKVQLPLFPGYVFVLCDLDGTYAADRTGRVAQILPVTNEPVLEHELEQVRNALAAGGVLELCDPLKKGTFVRITSGPLRGVTGVVDAMAREDRLILQVQMIGRAASLEIDRSLLEPVGDFSPPELEIAARRSGKPST